MSIIFDLHSHSTISDGVLSPAELVEHASEHGVNVLALTDHDDTSGLEIAALEAKRRGLQLINGRNFCHLEKMHIACGWSKN